MTVIEYEDTIVVIDCGLMFPEDEMVGIDLVLPDIRYLLDRKEQVAAILLTHGHEDHIGALPYLLPLLNVPLYGTSLTMGLVRTKLREHRLQHLARPAGHCHGLPARAHGRGRRAQHGEQHRRRQRPRPLRRPGYQPALDRRGEQPALPPRPLLDDWLAGGAELGAVADRQ